MTDALRLSVRLLGQLRPYRRVALLSLLAMAAAAALEPMLPATLQPVIDQALIQKNANAAWQAPLLLLLAFMAKGAAEYVAAVASQWVAQQAVADLRQQVFAHQMQMPLAEHQAQSAGRMLSRVLYDIPQAGQALASAWIVLVRDSLIVTCLTAFLFYTAWEMTLLLLIAAPPVALLVHLAGRKMRRSSHAIQHASGQLTGLLEAALLGIKEIKMFGAQAQEAARFKAASQLLRRETMRVVRVAAANVPLVQVLAAAAVAGVLFAASTLSANNRLSPGEFVAFIAAMAMLFEPIRRLTNVNASIQSGLAAASSIFELLDTAAEPALPARQQPDLAAPPLAQIGPCAPLSLRFERVTFRYPEQADYALQDFSLDVPAGQTLALVGASGSGKTTVVNLLARFYEPESGTIYLGGVPLAQWPLDALRQQIAWVGQPVVLFGGSVAANIAYGQSVADRAAIARAASAAFADEFIQQLPSGLDSEVGGNGQRLSGGQRQRIAIARAFFKNAPILLLDEATSALDSASESQVQAALAGLQRGRTTLVIAHRLSTIAQADWVVVLERGQIAEQGRHADLLAAGGAFARLHRLQASASAEI